MEGAAAARFLQLLSLRGVPRAGTPQPAGDSSKPADDDRESRVLLDKFAEQVFSTICQFGEFDPSDEESALDFLTRHAETYFVKRDPDDDRLERVLKFIETHEVPPNTPPVFGAPLLVGPQLSVQGDRIHRLEDDSSERVYAAYHALGEAGVRSRDNLIAAALTKAGVPRRDGSTDWSYTDVHDRVKAFERQQEKSGNAAQTRPAKERREKLREVYVDRWVSSFRFAKGVIEGRITP